MASKREQVLHKSVWPIAKRLERIYSLTGLASAGLLVLDRLPAELREEALAATKSGDFSFFDKDFMSLLEEILRERVRPALLQAHKETVEEIVYEADDEEVAAMLDAIGEMIEKGDGTRILGPKASAGAQKLRDVLIANFNNNKKKLS